MPIRINLLAEAQEQEELRRRDPVKRAIWLGGFAVFLALCVVIWLQLEIVLRKGELGRVESQLKARSSEFQQVLNNQQKLQDASQRLDGLQNLATNRLLYGTLLNALQKTTIDDVQLMRFRAEQTYVLNEGIKAKTNSAHRVTPGRPASVTEKILLTLDARDGGVNPGDQVNKFKQAMTDNPYFAAALGKTNEVRLTNLSPPQTAGGKPFVLFTLESRFSEKTR